MLFGRNEKEADNALENNKLSLPYSVSAEKGTSILLSCADNEQEKAKGIANSVGIRFLRSVPARLMQFFLADAGGTVGAFNSLISLDPAHKNNTLEHDVKSIIMGDGILVHSDGNEISKRIDAIKSKNDSMSGSLANYKSLREYNKKNPLTKELYNCIMMVNFPLGLHEKEIRQLTSLASCGGKHGIMEVLVQPDKEIRNIRPELNELIGDLYKEFLYLRLDSGSDFLKAMYSFSASEKSARIHIYGFRNLEAVAEKIRSEIIEAGKTNILFTNAREIFPERNERLSFKAQDGISVPIGYTGNSPFSLRFDDNHVHTIVLGRTGCGKSNLIHVTATNILMRYSYSEVSVYIIGFKRDQDYDIYTQYKLPGIKSVNITSDPKAVLAILREIDDQLRTKRKLSERTILLIDEFSEIIDRSPDEIKKEIVGLILNFARQGRSFKLHMLICGHELTKIDQINEIVNECGTRIALYCDDETQIRLLMGDEDKDKNLMSTFDSQDAGICLVKINKQINICRIALMDSVDVHKKLLEEIQSDYADDEKAASGYFRPMASSVKNIAGHPLQRFIEGKPFEGSKKELFKFHIGESYDAEYPLSFIPSENIWAAGGGTSSAAKKAGESVMFFSALSLLMRKINGSELEIICTNCADTQNRPDDEKENDRLGLTAQAFTCFFEYGKGENFGKVLETLTNELEKRRAGGTDGLPEIWWLLIRPEILKNNVTNNIMLTNILKEGPKYKIYSVFRSVMIGRTMKIFPEDNKDKREYFGDMICLEMNSADTVNVCGETLDPPPKGNEAYLIGNSVQNFRVYDLPDGIWMSELFKRLRYEAEKAGLYND